MSLHGLFEALFLCALWLVFGAVIISGFTQPARKCMLDKARPFVAHYANERGGDRLGWFYIGLLGLIWWPLVVVVVMFTIEHVPRRPRR